MGGREGVAAKFALEQPTEPQSRDERRLAHRPNFIAQNKLPSAFLKYMNIMCVAHVPPVEEATRVHVLEPRRILSNTECSWTQSQQPVHILTFSRTIGSIALARLLSGVRGSVASPADHRPIIRRNPRELCVMSKSESARASPARCKNLLGLRAIRSIWRVSAMASLRGPSFRSSLTKTQYTLPHMRTTYYLPQEMAWK